MKKLFIAFLTLVLVFTCTTVSFALMTPGVTEGHGVLTGMFVSGGSGSFMIGAEYGLTDSLAVGGEFGNNITKLDVKYELNPAIALLGGIIGSGNTTNPFIGIDAATSINKKFMLIGEIDMTMINGQFVFLYEAGGKYNITKQLDIRGGVVGWLGSGASSEASLELGVGFKF